MSIRSQLVAHRHAVRELDEPLREIEAAIISLTARTQVARARAMIRAADQLLSEALKQPLEKPVGAVQ